MRNEKYNTVPPWFSEFGEFEKPIPVPHWSKFSYYDEETGVLLTGVPDEILQKEDGSYFIIDYKNIHSFLSKVKEKICICSHDIIIARRIRNRAGF